VLLPPADRRPDAIGATVRWADYVAEEHAVEGPGDEFVSRKFWRRRPRAPVRVELPLDARTLRDGVELPDARGIWLHGRLETTAARGLPAGTRALSVFVVNRRGQGMQGRADE